MCHRLRRAHGSCAATGFVSRVNRRISAALSGAAQAELLFFAVNAGRIRELQPWFRGDYRVILNDGAELAMSRSYRQSVEERLLGV